MSFEIPFKSGSAGVFVVTPGTLSGSIRTVGTIGPGTFVTLTPPAGQRVKLFALSGSGGTFTGFRLKENGQQVGPSQLSRGDQGAAGWFAVGQASGGTVGGVYPCAETVESLVFETDAVVTFSLDASNTNEMTYNYAFGVLK